MPYIKQVSDEEATGGVKRELNKAYKRAGGKPEKDLSGSVSRQIRR